VLSNEKNIFQIRKKIMGTLQVFWKITWRSALVAVGYVIGLMLAGIIGAILGVQMGADTSGASNFMWMILAAFLLGVFLGPFASRLSLTRGQHFILWCSLILFNLGSVAIEGAYFAPDLVPLPIPMLLAQQALASAIAALAITLVFAKIGKSISWMNALRTRPWYSWIWRFILSAFSDLALYFVFGGLNYSLVTKPYYESHAGGLTVPEPQLVLIIESIRGLLIVFSVLLFLLSIRGTRRQLMVSTGWLLFSVGGIIPLIWQIGHLPFFLLFASAIEIFCQNFLTGAVAAWFMGIEDKHRNGD
jgi:hypothetical protein